MKRTPLYDYHLQLHAKMVDFAGWEMPLQYDGIKEETLAVRERQGMFDVSHMGEIFVTGEGAGEFLDYLLSRKVSHKNPALVNYAILCYEHGGAVDDLLCYQLQPDFYMLVVNASNVDKDFAHIEQVLANYQNNKDINIVNVSLDFGLIAIQGKGSLGPVYKALEKIYPDLDFVEELRTLKRFREITIPVDGKYLIVSRTGYTGEDGYEVYLPVENVAQLWLNLLEEGIKPCGLGARDALRLEAGLPLYGHELSENITPLEAGLDRFVELDHDFVGKKMADVKRYRLIGLKATDRSIPRNGYKVYYDSREVGEITSGSFSPTLNKGIAFALISPDVPEDISRIQVEIRKKLADFEVTDTPFI